MKAILVAPLLLAVIAPGVKAQSVYLTGFETPNYVVDASIVGIDEWFSPISPDAAAIVKDPALTSQGRRALTCWGGGPLESWEIAPGVFLLDGVWARPAPFEPAYPQTTLVRVQCDVRLDGPFTPYDLLSANLIARNGSWNSAQMWLSSDGNVYCNAWGTDPVTMMPFEYVYQYPTPVPHGMYVRLAIIYDYSLHLAAFEVNGVIVGLLPFGGPDEGGFNGVLLEFAALDDPTEIDPSLYTGYWDNVQIVAMPAVR